MARYALYLDSGPQRSKTMVHVPELLGCIANGPTTEAALEATPGAIRRYRALMAGHGEALDPEAPFETYIAEHITEGTRLGEGGLEIIHRDLDPIEQDEIELLLARFTVITAELATWAASQSDGVLDAKPERGRTARQILLHVLGPVGPYISAAVGGAPGHHALHRAAERGEIGMAEALERANELAAERIRATSPAQRVAVLAIGRAGQRQRTLRSSLRHLLEHHWEHLAELSRGPGGQNV